MVLTRGPGRRGRLVVIPVVVAVATVTVTMVPAIVVVVGTVAITMVAAIVPVAVPVVPVILALALAFALVVVLFAVVIRIGIRVEAERRRRRRRTRGSWSIVTAPLRASRLPDTLTRVVAVMLASARMFPANMVPGAERRGASNLPENVRRPCTYVAGVVTTTDEALAVVSVLPILKTHGPAPVRTSEPVN